MASRQTLVGSSLFNVLWEKNMKARSMAVDAGAATVTVGVDWPPVVLIDPGGGAVSALLPAEASAEHQMFVIFNTADAAEVLTVKEDAGTTTIVTVAQNEGCILFCDGTTWHGIVGGIT